MAYKGYRGIVSYDAMETFRNTNEWMGASARAIAADPQVIFFDEPTTGLDVAAAEAHPGVVAVMTPQNAPKLAKDPDAKDGPFTFRLDLLQNDRVRYANQPIAVVIAPWGVTTSVQCPRGSLIVACTSRPRSRA